MAISKRENLIVQEVLGRRAVMSGVVREHREGEVIVRITSNMGMKVIRMVRMVTLSKISKSKIDSVMVADVLRVLAQVGRIDGDIVRDVRRNQKVLGEIRRED